MQEKPTRKRTFYTPTQDKLLRYVGKLTEQEQQSLMRRCNKCQELKTLNDFFIRNKERGYRASYCKPCFVKINDKYMKNNPEKAKEIKRRYYQKKKREMRKSIRVIL